jgi:hypothetical protein
MMTWKLVGYFPKQRTTRSTWALRHPDLPFAYFCCPAAVEELCSVSDCIARGPDGWRDQGKHNFYDLYDTRELAWSVVPVGARADFELFAYRLHLVQFEDGQAEPIEVWDDLEVEPLPHSFVRLGWDAVVGGNHHSFGCSPLSCNGMAGGVGIPPVNHYFLVATEQGAIDLARSFSVSKPEPGPYCAVEVWRDAGSTG